MLVVVDAWPRRSIIPVPLQNSISHLVRNIIAHLNRQGWGRWRLLVRLLLCLVLRLLRLVLGLVFLLLADLLCLFGLLLTLLGVRVGLLGGVFLRSVEVFLGIAYIVRRLLLAFIVPVQIC